MAACVPVTGVIVCEGLRGSVFFSPLLGRSRPQSPRNLLNEVTDGESPPSQMGGVGRDRARLGQKARRGEEGRKGEGAPAEEGGR